MISKTHPAWATAIFLCTLMLPAHLAHSEEKKGPESDMHGDRYTAELPKGLEDLKLYAEHEAVMRLESIDYRVCSGLTRRCPDRCGGSGEFAKLTVVTYTHFERKDPSGDRVSNRMIRLSDFDRQPVGIKKLNDLVKSLKDSDDLLLVKWNHYYGALPGTKIHQSHRPIITARKISREEAAKLEHAD